MTELQPPGVDAAALAARFAVRAAESGDADIAYAVVDTPAGCLVAARTPAGLVRLAYEDFNGGVDAVLERLAARLSPRIVEAPARLDDTRRELDEYFAGTRRDFDIPIDWTLTTPFARRVLRATAAIPFGETSTYAQIAAAAGSPKGARPTGNALGSNPIPIIVPCHRVMATGGGLGGYTGGLSRKELLLSIEGVLLG
ncbi:MAG: methylated-DNA--[protein]-cysteine S-methyltransferase [Solirubrobacteraceae bacterium]